jgi:hypothetical protein
VVVGRGREGGGRLVLDAEAGVGSVSVRRAGAGEGADDAAS